MTEIGSGKMESGLGLQEKYKELYEPAAASKIVIDYLARNPFCDRSVLKSATNLRAHGEKYPEVIHLAGVALDTRTRVRNAYSELSSVSGQSQKRIAAVLYEAAQGKSPNVNRGVLEMGYLGNPFALVIVASKTDFQYLDTRDVAGHYNKALEIEIKSKQITVPFIAIQSGTSLSSEEILKHENRHAYNDMVKQSLERVDKVHLWGEDLPLYLGDASKIANSLTRIWNEHLQNPDRNGLIRSNQNWSRMMNYLLSYAKDEVVTRLMTNESTNDVIERHGVYDLQDTVFHLSKDDGVDRYFWDVYAGIVKAEVETVKRVMSTYSAFRMKEKEEILPWMLQRIPLGSWTNELNRVGISSEVEIISKILKTKKSRRSGSQLAINKRLEKVKSIQNELLIPQLVEYWQEIQT